MVEHCCKTCGEQCSCIYKLTRHIALMHPERAKPSTHPKICDECGGEYTNTYEAHKKLRKHVMNSNPLHKTLDIHISRRRGLYHHVRLADGTKREFESCGICEKDVSCGSMWQHSRTREHKKNEELFNRYKLPLILVSECKVTCCCVEYPSGDNCGSLCIVHGGFHT